MSETPFSKSGQFHITVQLFLVYPLIFLLSLPLFKPHLSAAVNAAPNALCKKHCTSLLTQCRGPMQTLAARRGTVGSAGRSFAHSLSTETA